MTNQKKKKEIKSKLTIETAEFCHSTGKYIILIISRFVPKLVEI